jgi:hypothetical protein
LLLLVLLLLPPPPSPPLATPAAMQRITASDFVFTHSKGLKAPKGSPFVAAL